MDIKQFQQSTTIQMLIFDKSKFSMAEATSWATKNDYKACKAHEAVDGFRLTLKEVGSFEEGSFRTIRLDSGVQADIGKLRNQDNMLNFADKAPQTFNIPGIEIFAVGTWNGDKWTEADLDQMVNNFQKTQKFLKPFLKLGHDEGQKLAQNDGLPSLGTVDNLRRIGNKLVADFKNVPSKIFDLIKRKAYSRVSSEIFINLKIMGEKFGKTLKAVALLGGDTPAVQNLADIMALYAEKAGISSNNCEWLLNGGEVLAYEGDSEAATYEVNKTDLMEDNKMKELKEQLADALKKLSEVEAELAQFRGDDVEKLRKKLDDLLAENKKLKVRVNELETKKSELDVLVKEHKDKALKSEIDKTLDGLIENKKLTPANREAAYTMIYNAKTVESEKKYKIGDKEVTPEEMVLKFFENNTVDVHTDLNSEAGHRQNIGNSKDEVNDAKIKAYAEKHKVSYIEAMENVFPTGVPNSEESEGE